MNNRIALSIGHRCSAHRIFKIIKKDTFLPSFFDGCFGDLSAHSILLANYLYKNKTFPTKENPNQSMIKELKCSFPTPWHVKGDKRRPTFHLLLGQFELGMTLQTGINNSLNFFLLR